MSGSKHSPPHLSELLQKRVVIGPEVPPIPQITENKTVNFGETLNEDTDANTAFKSFLFITFIGTDKFSIERHFYHNAFAEAEIIHSLWQCLL